MNEKMSVRQGKHRFLSLLLALSLIVPSLFNADILSAYAADVTIGESDAEEILLEQDAVMEGTTIGDSQEFEEPAYEDYKEVSKLSGPVTLQLSGDYRIYGKVIFTSSLFTDTSGIEVRLMQRDPVQAEKAELARTTAAADGTYSFENVPDGRYIVQIDETDGYTELGLTVTISGQSLNRDLGLTAKGDGNFQVSGKVSGVTPVSGIQVKALHAGTKQLLDSATAGADGSYQLTKIPHGDFILTVEGTKRYETYTENVHMQYSHITGKNITLSGKYQISGTVSGVGKVSGLTVYLYDASQKQVGTAVTNGTGGYAFEGLKPGSYIVKLPKADDYFEYSQTVTIAAKDLVHNIVLRPYVFIISGAVTGVPVVSGIPVRLLNASGQQAARVVTGQNGAYAFEGVKPGTYKVVVDQSADYYAYSGQASVVDKDVSHPIKLVPYVFSVSGTVSGVQSVSGLPVALHNAAGQQVATAVTDAAGRYGLANIKPGTYTVKMEKTDKYDAYSATVTVSNANVTHNIRLAAMLAVSGNVRGAANISGIEVGLYNTSSQKLSSVKTDAAGAYRFQDLRAGTYELRVAGTGEYYAFSVRVTVSSQDMTQDITLVPIGYTVIKTVDSVGKTLPSIYVYVESQDGAYQSAYTDANGEARFEMNPTKTYTVRGTYAGNTQTATVKNQKMVTLTFPQVLMITGTVRDTAMKPVSGMIVSIYRSDGSFMGSVTSNSAGAYSLKLPSDTRQYGYRVSAKYVTRYKDARKSPEITIDRTHLDMGRPVDLTVYPCEATGYVYSSAGVPLSGIRVSVSGGYYYTTGDDGRFILTGLENGCSYTVNYGRYNSAYETQTGRFTYVLDQQVGKYVNSEPLVYYLKPVNENNTNYTVSIKASEQTAAIGDIITLRPVVTKKTASNASVIVTLAMPAGVDVVSPGSFVSVGGGKYEYTFPVIQSSVSLSPVSVRVTSAENDVINFGAGLRTTSGSKAKSDTASVNVLYGTIFGPSSSEDGMDITLYGNASKNSEVTIKGRDGTVYAVVRARERYYSATINLPANQDGSIKRYELLAEVRSDATGTKYYQTNPIVIDVGAGVVSIDDIVANGYKANPLYGIPVFTAYVYGSSPFYGYAFNVSFAVNNGEGWTPSIQFADKTVTNYSVGSKIGKTTYYHFTVPTNWHSRGGVEELSIILKKGSETKTYAGASVRILIDPSGYIYDYETDARIEGATVTLEKYDGGWKVWEDPDGRQQNPQTSDKDGRFEWYTEEGKYRVRVSKEGYQALSGGKEAIANTAKGQYDSSIPDDSTLTVLPVQLEVNIPLKRIRTPGEASAGGGKSSSSSGDDWEMSDYEQGDALNSYVSRIRKAKDGDIIRINMGSQYQLPAETFAALRGRDVRLVLNFGSYQWTLYGMDVNVPERDFETVDFRVRFIKDAALSEKAGGKDLALLDLAHSGMFPVKSVLTFKLDGAQTGEEYFLYYDNPQSGALELSDSDKAADSGAVSFVFDHASRYAVTGAKLRASDTYKINPTTGGSTKSVLQNKEIGKVSLTAEVDSVMDEAVQKSGYLTIRTGDSIDPAAIIPAGAASPEAAAEIRGAANAPSGLILLILVTLVSAGIFCYLQKKKNAQ